jgi:chemotaxis signal transduction protein
VRALTGQIVVVRAGGHAYGLGVAAVVEVTRMVALAPVPGAEPWLAGMADVRGVPVPVVDLAARLGRAPLTPVLDRRIVITGDPGGADSPGGLVGLLVDEVTGVAPGGETVAATGGTPLVRGAVRVGDEMVMVLDETALRAAGHG